MLAAERGFERIAFPAISTGVYRYPLREAAQVAVGTILEHEGAKPARVILCTFDAQATVVTREVLEAMSSARS
jgi:O-acetyl-ADP-ribose deacetylase (regulator of RNase III)